MLSGGGIISLGGLDFGVEIAEVYPFVIVPYCGAVLSLALVKPYPFVAGAGVSGLGVCSVLRRCCESEVCSAVVESVSVDMVDAICGRWCYELSVH
jgi:hypothetical protein